MSLFFCPSCITNNIPEKFCHWISKHCHGLRIVSYVPPLFFDILLTELVSQHAESCLTLGL